MGEPGVGGVCFVAGADSVLLRWMVLTRTQSSGCPAPPQAKIARQLAAREHQQRKRNLTKYIPNTASAIFGVLESMAGAAAK